MKDNHFEKRMEMLKKSYERIPSSFDKEQVLLKIEEESKSPLYEEPAIERKDPFIKHITVWAVSIASVLIIGILSATFLLSDKNEQATDSEITEQFLLQLEESYKEEREKRRVLLKMDEEKFAEINFIQSADRTASQLGRDGNMNVLSIQSNPKEVLKEQYDGLISDLHLPSEMIANLLHHPLTDDEEASIEFMTEYRQKVNALIDAYNEALLESQSAKDKLNSNNLEKNRDIINAKLKAINNVFFKMYEAMGPQNIRFLENEYMEFTEASYEVQDNYTAIKNALHEHVQGYYDMIIEEPYMVGGIPTKSLELSVVSVLEMQDTLIKVKQDNNLFPSMQNHFSSLLLDVVKGSQYSTIFDVNGIVKIEYQEQWRKLSKNSGIRPTIHLMLPIVKEMEASGWKKSRSWDELDTDKISEVLELARNGELGETVYVDYEEPEKSFDQPYLERINKMYESFSKTRDQSLLTNAAAVEIVGLYFYAEEIGDYDTQYDLYVQDNRYRVIDREEHLEFSEKNQVQAENKMIELYKGVSFEAKVEFDGTMQGIAKLFGKPGTFSDEEEDWRHFSMMKTEFGWRVHFLPMQ